MIPKHPAELRRFRTAGGLGCKPFGASFCARHRCRLLQSIL